MARKSTTVICTTALLLAATVVAQSEPANVAKANTCRSCVASVSQLHSSLSAVTSSPRAVTKLQQEFCGANPAPGQRLCWEIFTRALPALGVKSRSAPLACADLGLCSQAEMLGYAAQQNDDVTCPLCEYLVTTVKQQLEDPQTEEELLERANMICDTLPADAQPTCHQYVKDYGKQLFAWVHESDPESICTMAGTCDPSTRLSTLPPALKASATQLLALGDDDQCNTCQLVIIEASSVISDPKTQKEILDYVKQSCKDFQSFQDQCESYIDLYGPTILAMAKQYLKPEICAELGFCKSMHKDSLSFAA